MQSFGPAISVQDAPLDRIESTLDSVGILEINPVFDIFDKDFKTLRCLKRIPTPDSVSPSDPEAIELAFEIPGVEPGLAFPDWVRGAAVVMAILDPSQREDAKWAIQQVGDRVVNGKGVPAIDVDFYDTVRELELSIIDNGEPISWRPIIAFMSGAFWLLSFIKDPYKKHGDRSPLSFVHDKVLDSAVLGYAPR